MILVSNAGVEVVYGSESLRVIEAVGKTVAWARWQLKHPLNIPRDAVARLNGRDAQPSDLLLPADVLEFLVMEGHKGGDSLVTPAECMELTGLLPQEYEYLRHLKMPLIESPDGPQIAMGTVRKWLRDQPGLFAAAARRAFARSRLQVNESSGAAILDGYPYPISLEQAVFLKALLRDLGQWVSSRFIGQSRDDLSLNRLDRVKRGLPEPIRRLIESSTKGYRLLLE